MLVNTIFGSVVLPFDETLLIAPQSGSAIVLNGDVNIGSSANLIFDGYSTNTGQVTPSVTFNGLVEDNGGVLNVSNGASGTGQIELNDGLATFYGDAGTSVSLPLLFTSGLLDLAQGGTTYNGTISDFGQGDTIVIGEMNPRIPFTTTFADGVLTITPAGLTPDVLNFAGDYTAANFAIEYGGGGIQIRYLPCFATGTLIASLHGDIEVERLKVGDDVVLAQGGTARVTWIGHRRQIGCDVVRFLPGSLGSNSPRRDLVVSEDHGMFQDGVLVQAALLVNGETMLREHRDEVTFFHVELERHGILLAEGAAAESYLDTGNRRQFSNCTMAYDPVGDAAGAEPCAEMVFGGPRLEAIRARLRDFAPA